MELIETLIEPLSSWIFHGGEWLIVPKTMFVVISWCLFVAGCAIGLTHLYDKWSDRRDRRMERRNRWANYRHWNVERNLNGKWEG